MGVCEADRSVKWGSRVPGAPRRREVGTCRTACAVPPGTGLEGAAVAALGRLLCPSAGKCWNCKPAADTAHVPINIPGSEARGFQCLCSVSWLLPPSCAMPGLRCPSSQAPRGPAAGLGRAVLHQQGIAQCSLYVLFNHSCFILNPSICMSFSLSLPSAYCKSLHLVTWACCCTGRARPCVTLPFWICLRLSLLVSIPSSPVIMCCSLLLWVNDNELSRLLCYWGMHWLVCRRKTACIKLQITSWVRSQELVAGGRTSVSCPCSWPRAFPHCLHACALAVTTRSVYGT